MIALLLSVSGALAQAPAGLPEGIPPELLAQLNQQMQAPQGEVRYLTAKTTSVRFPGDSVPGPVFEQGERVELIVAENGKTRIHQGDRYGWVPDAALTTEAPPVAPAAPSSDPLLTAPPLLLPKGK